MLLCRFIFIKCVIFCFSICQFLFDLAIVKSVFEMLFFLPSLQSQYPDVDEAELKAMEVMSNTVAVKLKESTENLRQLDSGKFPLI